MSEKRYFKIEYDEEWYLFDSTTISEQLVKEQAEYGYGVFANSLSPSEMVDLLNEQQATINLLLDLLYQSEETVINEYSSHIGEDMDKLDKIFKEKDIKEIERFVRGCDDE